MENQFDDIMARIRVRHTELSDDVKENDKPTTTISIKQEDVIQSPTKVFGSSINSNEAVSKNPVAFRPPDRTEPTTPPSQSSTFQETTENVSTSSTKKSRFSALAQELEDFEFDYTSQYNKPKEAYMKGRSPRMSIGEARAQKSPNFAQPSKSADSVPVSITQSEFEARRIKFAQPMVNVNYLPNESSIFSGSSVNDMSTVLGGSAEMMNVTTSSLSCDMSMNQQITTENTIINAQSCDNREAILRERHTQNMSSDEYGAHTFMRKKVPKKEAQAIQEEETAHTPTATTSHSIHTLVSSPKPYSRDVGKSIFSPVHFTPRSTSSPKFAKQPLQPESVLSPSKSAALEGSVAKTRKMQFEQKFQSTYVQAAMAPIPTPRQIVNPVVTKKELPPKVPTEAQVHTQWRGQANTPVVQGARAEDKTAGTDVLGAGVGKLKNLKSRWEFSSVTGTPIHPDATEDSLIATAKKMQETALPRTFQIGNRSISGRKGPSASSIHSSTQQVRSTTASPAAKNVRYGRDELADDVFEKASAPEKNEEEDPIEDDVEEDVHTGDIPDDETSRFIDSAFGFMNGPGTGTPSPYRSFDGKAPLARFEGSVSPKPLGRNELMEHQEVIEEEDVPVGDTDEEDQEEERTPRGDVREVEEEATTERERKPSDSSLPYSVSFYRKIQRERVGEASTPLTPVKPSAPSLTSPEKLRQLTAGHSSGDYATPPSGGRLIESERQQKERLNTAIRVEEELVAQSKRAMAFSREKPSFRGSREEFEAQWALLVHVEKHRALVAEYERLKREGPRIVEGPRGTIEVAQLTVNLARDFVSAHIASTKKSDEVYYFVAVLRWGEQVDVSKMVTSDGALNRKGILEFPMPLQLTRIPSDFRATIEIYGQRSMRELTTHEDKFKLKSSTLKAKTRNTFLGGSGSSANTSAFVQPSSPCSSNFNLLGTFSFDINCPGKHLYNMAHTVHPLEGVTLMKVRKHAIDGADITFSGFLSMYQRTREGLGSWTRYWCVLDNGEMKFWRHPEDEGSKRCLVLLDLSTCCRAEGASTVNDICPYPNSFHIDVWVPKEEEAGVGSNATLGSTRGGIEQLRVMLAADTNPDLLKWLSVINSTSKQLCTWRNPIVQ